jgi:cytochrome c
MSGIELNKVVAAVLVAGLVGMVSGNLADILYKPNINAKHGYNIEINDNDDTEKQSAEVEVKVDVIALLAKASVENGASLVKKCTLCHDMSQASSNRIGPGLWNVVNNKKANRADFSYSKALIEKAGTWNYEELYHFINKPSAFIPGTKMNFIGFKKPQDVVDVIAYLRTLSDNPEK